MKKVYCFSKKELIKLLESNKINLEKDIIISINNRREEFNLIDWTTEYLLSESKEDILEDNNILNIRVNDDDEDFSPQLARTIIQFIKNNKSKDIIVHCIMGKSRSQAVSRFILDTWPMEYEYARKKENPLKTPNYHILCTLKRVWRIEFEEKETSV